MNEETIALIDERIRQLQNELATHAQALRNSVNEVIDQLRGKPAQTRPSQ